MGKVQVALPIQSCPADVFAFIPIAVGILSHTDEAFLIEFANGNTCWDASKSLAGSPTGRKQIPATTKAHRVILLHFPTHEATKTLEKARGAHYKPGRLARVVAEQDEEIYIIPTSKRDLVAYEEMYA